MRNISCTIERGTYERHILRVWVSVRERKNSSTLCKIDVRERERDSSRLCKREREKDIALDCVRDRYREEVRRMMLCWCCESINLGTE